MGELLTNQNATYDLRIDPKGNITAIFRREFLIYQFLLILVTSALNPATAFNKINLPFGYSHNCCCSYKYFVCAEDPSSAKTRRGAHMSNLSCSVADDYNVNIDHGDCTAATGKEWRACMAMCPELKRTSIDLLCIVH